MQDFQVNSIGGVNLDIDPRSIPSNQMTYANDVELLGEVGGQDTSASPLPSSVLSFEIPALSQQYQVVRLKFNPAATLYNLIIKDASGNAIGAGTITITVASLPSPTIANFVAAINTAVGASGYNASLVSSDGLYFAIAIFYGTATPAFYTILEYELLGGTNSKIPVYTLQEYYNPAGLVSGQLIPLQSKQVNEVLFVFSQTFDNEMSSIGYGLKDNNGTWTYVGSIVTRNFNFPSNQVIEIQAEEINNNQYGLYWTDNVGKMKVLYVPTDLTSPLKYTLAEYVTASQGLFTLESIDEQTNLQIQNYAISQYSGQNQSGGALEAGTWFYYVASGINRNYSEWSPASEPIAVFSETTNSPSSGAMIGGDKTPKVTSKANIIVVRGVDSKVYDTVKIAAVLNQGGVYSSIIVGEYDTTLDSADELFITHTGLESSIEDYDRNLLPPVQDVFLRSKNIQTKDNRMNLANVEVQVDTDLSAVFGNVTLGQVRGTMDSVGVVSFDADPLFRAGVNTSYSSSSVGEQTILIDNDSTLPNFDNGLVYDLGSRLFTVGTTGDYGLSWILNGSYTINLPIEVYIKNVTTGLEYAKTTLNSPIVTTVPQNIQLSNSQTVTLQIGDQLALKAVFRNFSTSSADYKIISASFSATKALTDYATKSLRVGEYQLPQNIATKTGYMVNETYPFFAKIEYNSGFMTQWHHLGNYSFGDGSQFALLQDGRLTNSVLNGDVYTYGLTVDGIDITTIKNDIRRIHIGRGICNPTILGTGMFVVSDSSTGGAGGTFNSGYYTGNTNGDIYGVINNSTSNNRYFGMMLCPDWAIGNIKPQFQDGDYLIVYGAMTTLNGPIIAGGNTKWGGSKQFQGYFIPGTGSPVTINIADAAYCEWNQGSRVLRNDAASLFLGSNLSNDGTISTMASEGMAIALESRINPITGTSSSSDNGVYYVQYYRPNANQYVIKDVAIIPCNASVEIDATTDDILPQIVVYGGDTYTQKTYQKVLYNALNPDAAKKGTLTSFLGYYSQNKINAQMRFTDKTFTNLPFPFGNTLNNYLFGLYDSGEQFQIDLGYDWSNKLSEGRAYNANIPVQSNLKARIYYSQQKPLNALQDSYRVILPNDFKDLSAKDGEINGLYDINEVMVALQPFKVSVLPYQSDVMVSGTEVYIGNGGVYAQRQRPISTYGASLKSGTLVAENESGNSQLYWFSSAANAFMRYGKDGIKNLSTQDGWRTWYLNYTKLIDAEFDVVLGFDRNRSAIFLTARAVNTSVPLWNIATPYTTGQYVRYSAPNKYQTFEGLTDVYVALGNSTGSNPFDTPASWQYVPITNSTYYNYFTSVYNEKFNFFQGFFSLLVSRYFSFNGSILVTRGKAPFNKVYELFGGSGYLQWLDSDGIFKQGSFEVEFSVNKNGIVPKRYISYGAIVGTNHIEANNPTTILTTDTQTSDSNGSEFEFTNGQISEGVFSDNSDDPLLSEFMKVRFISTAYYRIYSAVCQFYNKSRNLLK